MKKNKDQQITKKTWEERKQSFSIKYQEIRAEMKNPVKKAVRRQNTADKAASILRGFILFGLSFVILFPIFQQFTLALRHPLDINNPLVNWIPENFSFINFKIAGEILQYWNSLWNTVQLSAISTLFQLFATALAGYAFARLRFKGSNILFWVLLLTLIVPPQTVALSRMLYISNFDVFGIFTKITGSTIKLKNTPVVFYILSATGQGIRASLFIFIFRQFFRGIPVELEESAQIDGAGVVRTFWSVMLPNARGAITTVALFAFVWQWNDVYYTRLYSVSSDAFPLLTMRLTNVAEWVGNIVKQAKYQDLIALVGENVQDNPLFTSVISNTAALMMMLPLLIAYIFVQRLFIEGIERTGIVG